MLSRCNNRTPQKLDVLRHQRWRPPDLFKPRWDTSEDSCEDRRSQLGSRLGSLQGDSLASVPYTYCPFTALSALRQNTTRPDPTSPKMQIEEAKTAAVRRLIVEPVTRILKRNTAKAYIGQKSRSDRGYNRTVVKIGPWL